MSVLPMDFERMRYLDAARVLYLVYHTAESADDCSAAEINRWHRQERGWAAIGYHFVVRETGLVEPGRPVIYQGAHVHGINHCSLGVCLSGNGDLHPATAPQWEAGIALGARLCREYAIPTARVIGHREVNHLIELGLVPAVEPSDGKSNRTSKSCPGVHISPAKIRAAITARLYPHIAPHVAVPADPLGEPGLPRPELEEVR